MNSVTNLFSPTALQPPPSYELDLVRLTIGMLLAAALSYGLAAYYTRYGKSLSNRALLAKDFVLITLTTTLVITVVKSSIALSLGMVGALSIVRFRSAIKEPEELAYLFLCIGIGLGCGADQWLATCVASLIIVISIHLRAFFRPSAGVEHNLFVNIEATNQGDPAFFGRLVEILKSRTDVVDLRRVDARADTLQTTFMVHMRSGAAIQEIITEIQKLAPSASVTFVDHSRRADL